MWFGWSHIALVGYLLCLFFHVLFSGEKTLSDIDAVLYFFFFYIGACLGSFANVVIYRLPIGESVVRPRSHCQSCKKNIAWHDNIPIFSWLLLRGRCRNCGARFSIRYFFVELLTASLFVLAYFYIGLNWNLLEALIFIFALICCTFIDFDPNNMFTQPPLRRRSK